MKAHRVRPESTLRAVVRIPRVLSIAGTDPTGGAGIQADLKSIAANGGYGMAVTTALVAQNTQGVRSIHVPPVEFLTEQLTAVSDDVTIDAVKLGMLFDTPIIDAVADWLRTNRPPVVVLDPVMVATSGDRLLTEDAEQAVRDLLQHADLVTPNIPELAVLACEPPASTWPEVLRQAATVSGDHGVLVLAKGGHLDGAVAPDALADGGAIVAEFSTRRVATRNTHGTGCSLSSAVATLQARSQDWEAAIRQAKTWLTESLAAADELKVGRGHGPVSHFAGLWERAGLTGPTPQQIARDWWAGIRAIREEIDELAFVRRLGDGTLPKAAFVWYLGQDALYLRDYARALAEASRLAPTAHEQAFWASCAHGAIATEIELHGQWLPSDGLLAAEAGDVTTGYLNHLLAAAAKGGYDELVAALLPCFWIYVDVGSRLIAHAVAENPYAAWLRTYAAPEFQEASREAVAIVTSRAAAASETVRNQMRRAFEVSARHELDFFAAPLR